MARLCWILLMESLGAAALVPLTPWSYEAPLAGIEVDPLSGPGQVSFVSRIGREVRVYARSMIFRTGMTLDVIGANASPDVSYLSPLPVSIRRYETDNRSRWAKDIQRFGAARLKQIYPGIEATYLSTNAGLTLRLAVQPGADLRQIQFGVFGRLINSGSNSLFVQQGFCPPPSPSRQPPCGYEYHYLAFGEALQESEEGVAVKPVAAVVESGGADGYGRFGFEVADRDPSLPLTIELKLTGGPGNTPAFDGVATHDAEGNAYVAYPFEERRIGIDAIHDIAVCKFAASGELKFVTFLGGSFNDIPKFIGLSPDGSLVVAGETGSSDFPVARNAYQPSNAGPNAIAPGTDLFAATFNRDDGQLVAATYLGGPNSDNLGEAAIGYDGSIYFLPKGPVEATREMPLSAGALIPALPEARSYAARLSPSLDRLLYGTYVPGFVHQAKLHTDGSVYFAGLTRSDFPVTPDAYRRERSGGADFFLARLDSSGSRLIAATYLGISSPGHSTTLAVNQDGGVWMGITSDATICCRILLFDPNLSRVAIDKPFKAHSLATDRIGRLYATAPATPPSANAFLKRPCPYTGYSYIGMSAQAVVEFSTYLPAGADWNFDGMTPSGVPAIRSETGRFEIREGEASPVFVGCVVDAATRTQSTTLFPGEIVSIFGSGLGPSIGVTAEISNGKLPISLGGTRVLLNGEPAWLLYSSEHQVNALVPGSLSAVSSAIAVEYKGTISSSLNRLLTFPPVLRLFSGDDSQIPSAVALNEDGMANSPLNPALTGSQILLFGNGGGETVPAVPLGGVNPLELRPLKAAIALSSPNAARLPIAYAGAAPGLIAGVLQINVRLPDTLWDIPEPDRARYPIPGSIPITVHGEWGEGKTVTVFAKQR